ncbi:MAG: hypothetical protein ACI4R9_08665 [Kiritimatiellia bacterium]
MGFPVVAHHRIIVYADKKDDATTAALFASFDLIEPIALGHVSAGGKYATYALSVRLSDRAEMNRLDAVFPQVPGLKMVL